MIRQVMRHEARALATDRALLAFVVLFGVMFAVAVVNGVRWVSLQRSTLAAAASVAERRLAQLEHDVAAAESGAAPGAPDPRAPSVVGGARGARHAALPPGPLAPLAIGQSDLLPYYHALSLDTNESALSKSGELENPLTLMVGRFDVAFVLVQLMPLLILALSYNMLSAEKEQGTLALTLSQPVALGTVLGGKIALRTLVVAGLAIALSVLGGLVAARAEAGLVRLALWAALVLAYALFWLAMAAAVNALGRGSAWNATVLVGTWLALVVVLPAAANIGASLLFPLPSRIEMVTAERAAIRSVLDRRSELLARYYEDHPEMAAGVPLDTTNLDARAWAASEEVFRLGREVGERYERTLARQQALVRAFRFASPAILMQEALNDIAGTGDVRHAEFRRQVRGFVDAWRRRFVPLILGAARVGTADLRALPAFEYVEERERTLVARVAVGLGVLAGLTLVVAAAAAHRLRRYPVAG